MLVLFETPAGFALFKVLDEGKLDKVEDLWKEFTTSDSARKVCAFLPYSTKFSLFFCLLRALMHDLTHVDGVS
jgi:hypothetical protein